MRNEQIELVGLSEFADLLGVTKQRADQIRKSPTCPKPVAELACGPIWLKAEAEQFASTRPRAAGRPRRG